MSRPESVLLLTAWHLPTVPAIVRLLIAFRRLERGSCWLAPGLVRSHRWASRRSLLLTSWWEQQGAAEEWMESEAFRRFDARARGAGARAYFELRDGDGLLN